MKKLSDLYPARRMLRAYSGCRCSVCHRRVGLTEPLLRRHLEAARHTPEAPRPMVARPRWESWSLEGRESRGPSYLPDPLRR